MMQDLAKQAITKQDLIEQGVIGWKTTDIFIRDARPSDHAAIRDLTLAAYQEYAEPLGAYWKGYEDGIQRALENVRPAQQIVVDDNGEIVASVLLYPADTIFTSPSGSSVTAPFPEIRLLAASPRKQGRGLGTLLTREAIERAREQRAKAVMLHTINVMPHLAHMYRAMGFEPFPRFDFEFAPGVRLGSYRLDLEGK
jgi:predicted N-acetyltransferase YhbS